MCRVTRTMHWSCCARSRVSGGCSRENSPRRGRISAVRTLLKNGSVYAPADPHATAIAFDDSAVTWLGDDIGAASYANGADEVVDLRGRLVTPAFVDAHVHAAQTGALLTGLDLTGSANLTECLDRLATFARNRPTDEVVV